MKMQLNQYLGTKLLLTTIWAKKPQKGLLLQNYTCKVLDAYKATGLQWSLSRSKPCIKLFPAQQNKTAFISHEATMQIFKSLRGEDGVT